MKKLLILFVALFSLVGTMPGNAASSQSAFGAQQRKNRNIMDLPIFERLVIIVKHYETLHNGLTTWPYYQKYNVIQSNIDYEHVYHCTPIYL